MGETSSPTWSALSTAIHDDEHELVAKHARHLLATDAADDLAAHCLLVASLQISDLDEAQKVLDEHPRLLPETRFDRAYLLYRQRRFQEAIDLLDTLTNEEERSLQLRALLAARLGQNQAAADIYKTFLGQLEQDDDENYRAELLSNYLAVCSPSETETSLHEAGSDQITFTMLYNAACSKISQKDYVGAEEMLRRAMKLCQKADLSNGELVEELSPIQVQLAYTRQMQGYPNEAKELYQSVLEMVPSGIHTPAVAVASLNLMSLRHGDEKHFDSAKRLARALKVDNKKLTDFQIAALERNRVLLLLFEKQLEECIRRCKELLANDSTDTFVSLVLACALSRSKKTEEAFEVLRKQHSVDTQLALVQLLIEQKQNDAALATLKDPILNEIRLKPAVVSLMVSLQDKNSAVKTLVDAVSKNAALAGFAGPYLQRLGKSEEALDILSDAVKSSPDNLRLLKCLAKAYFSAGREIPAHIISRLPPVPSLSAEQIAAYEQAAVTVTKHSKKKSEAVSDATVTKPKSKKKKKKKIRYPKGFDPANPGPPPDPERWLPRYERTKGRRRNQVSMKGPQGALPTAAVQGSGRSRAHRVTEDKNVLDNQRQKAQATASGAPNPQAVSKKKGKKRR